MEVKIGKKLRGYVAQGYPSHPSTTLRSPRRRALKALYCPKNALARSAGGHLLKKGGAKNFRIQGPNTSSGEKKGYRKKADIP